MEVRSEARWKRFPSPDLPSDHICCITERERNRGFCNLILLQHQTTGTNKATATRWSPQKEQEKRPDSRCGAIFSVPFFKIDLQASSSQGMETWILPFWRNIVVWNQALVVFVLVNECRNCLTCLGGCRKHATWCIVTHESSKKTLL